MPELCGIADDAARLIGNNAVSEPQQPFGAGCLQVSLGGRYSILQSHDAFANAVQSLLEAVFQLQSPPRNPRDVHCQTLGRCMHVGMYHRKRGIVSVCQSLGGLR